MVNEVISAVSRTLKKIYGYTVYGADKPLQEFVTPSFLVNLIEVSDIPKLNDRFERKISLCVQYFPKDENHLTDLWKISGTILKKLEWLSLKNSDIIRAADLRCEVLEGVLNAFFSYTIPMKEKQEEQTEMQELTQYIEEVT